MQRKQFRIEAMLPDRQPAGAERVAAPAQNADRDKLARGAAELAAVMEAMEQACTAVLGSAERIDNNAKTIAESAGSDDTRRLADDIRGQMARVFEICHFHDVAGQRISKVIALLTGLDDHLSGFTAPSDVAPPRPGLINGPRLDGASGHISQDEIDALLR